MSGLCSGIAAVKFPFQIEHAEKMQRKAILVALKRSPDQINCPQLSAWIEFLCSDTGGGWKRDQIVETFGWGRNQLLDAVKDAGNADYSLIVYVGRGRSVKIDVPWSELQLEISSDESVLERELNTGSPRCAMILDASSCNEESASNEILKILRPRIDVAEDEFVQAYDAAIENAERGVARIWVTSAAETTSVASSFTHNIISHAVEWSLQSKGILSFPRAVDLVTDSDGKHNRRKIEYRGGRRVGHFPFAVGILQ